MAKILADVEKLLDTTEADQETAHTQQERNWKPLLLVPVMPVALAAIAGVVVFFRRRASKKSEW